MPEVKCEHEWHYDENGYVEQCVPAICIKCGKKGCAHDVGDKLWFDEEFKRKFFDEGVFAKMESAVNLLLEIIAACNLAEETGMHPKNSPKVWDAIDQARKLLNEGK